MSFHDLPPETSAKIFRYAVGPFTTHPANLHSNRHTVGNVCTLWRAIALADPHMWSAMYITEDTPVVRISQALKRSGRTAISLHINFSVYSNVGWFLERLMPPLVPAFRRCAHFALVTPDAFITHRFMSRLANMAAPALRSVYLDVVANHIDNQRRYIEETQGFEFPAMFRAKIPRLLHFSIVRGFFLWGQSPAFKSIRHLHLDSPSCEPTMKEWHDVFLATPLLESLYLRYAGCVVPATPTRSPPLLRLLTHLSVGSIVPGTIPLVASLHTPALRTLEFMAADDDEIFDFWLLCRGILPYITTAILNLCTLDTDVLADLLRPMDHLRRLDLRDSNSFTADAFYDAVTDLRYCFTNLSVAVLQPMATSLVDDLLHGARTSAARDLHLIFPHSERERFFLHDHFVRDGITASVPVACTIDYWLSPALLI
ncbi:hypothetical protein DFH06DRAFT_1315008 [Mycena polygramma]|nr:hypothetical protein DFH06DRAFT_1315008 [Mycena polygramma]